MKKRSAIANLDKA